MENINKKENQTENIDNIVKIKNFINTANLKKKEKKKMDISETVKDVSEDFPEELKLKLEEFYKRRKKFVNDIFDDFLGSIEVEDEELDDLHSSFCTWAEDLDEKYLKEEVSERGKEIREAYFDKNLNLPTKAFAKLDLISKIDNLFNKENVEEEDLKKVARVSFDLNGLKPVNDLNNDYSFGDKYLKISAEAIGSKEAREVAKKHGIDPGYIVTRDGGDEFGVILTSDQPISEEALDEFITTTQMIVWNNKEIATILDFDNPKILAAFANVSMDELKKFDSIEDFKKAYNIPLDYKYRGIISAGASRLYDALLESDFEQKNKIINGDSYDRMLEKGMGMVFSSSDNQMKKNKKETKKDLVDGNVGDHFETEDERKAEVEKAKMLARVYSRTEEEKELKEKIETLEKEKAEAEKRAEEAEASAEKLAKEREDKLKANIEALIKAGGSASDILNFIEKK